MLHSLCMEVCWNACESTQDSGRLLWCSVQWGEERGRQKTQSQSRSASAVQIHVVEPELFSLGRLHGNSPVEWTLLSPGGLNIGWKYSQKCSVGLEHRGVWRARGTASEGDRPREREREISDRSVTDQWPLSADPNRHKSVRKVHVRPLCPLSLLVGRQPRTRVVWRSMSWPCGVRGGG